MKISLLFSAMFLAGCVASQPSRTSEPAANLPQPTSNSRAKIDDVYVHYATKKTPHPLEGKTALYETYAINYWADKDTAGHPILLFRSNKGTHQPRAILKLSSPVSLSNDPSVCIEGILRGKVSLPHKWLDLTPDEIYDSMKNCTLVIENCRQVSER